MNSHPFPVHTSTPLSDPEQHQFLTFMLTDELFAIDIMYIKEIIEYSPLTRVPMVPNFIRGVLNLRGSVLPVIDLAVRFGKKPAAVTKRTCIVVVEIKTEEERITLGVVVDIVHDVIELSTENIEPTPAFGNRIRNDFIRQIGKLKDGFIILLDVEHVLSVEELSMLEQIDH